MTWVRGRSVRGRSGIVCGRRGRVVLGPQEGDELLDLLVAERIAKGRHLLAAVQDLVGHLLRGPCLVFADIGETGTLFGAFERLSVAIGAALVAVQGGAGFHISRGIGGEGGGGGENDESWEEFETRNHWNIFAWRPEGVSRIMGGGGPSHSR